MSFKHLPDGSIRFLPETDNLSDLLALTFSIIPDRINGDRLYIQQGITAKLLTAKETHALIEWLAEQLTPRETQKALDGLFSLFQIEEPKP